MTTTTYDQAAASSLARTAAEVRLGQVQDELEREYEIAVALAGEYADHLAVGGDPTDYPKSGDRDRQHHGLARIAREAVFDAWSATRERESVSYPWGQGMPYRWIVQEYLLDRLGEPVPVSTLAVFGRGRKESPNTVAEAAWSLQVATNGKVRVRKVKVDGKVAWLARLPVDGDDQADLVHREGVWGSMLERLTNAEKREALSRPFKSRVFEYPTEKLP